jgi:hypothetical protein
LDQEKSGNPGFGNGNILAAETWTKHVYVKDKKILESNTLTHTFRGTKTRKRGKGTT